jgi:hypothetical protein
MGQDVSCRERKGVGVAEWLTCEISLSISKIKVKRTYLRTM